eukprot:maker-scaffold877_size102761-snap-gene-0.15 protein:Tk03562 transcript:maker-scaffold877_size102761-snap-gene-0.15-mRNA-1 annotation:"hypothetical protein KGM_18655"
MLASKPILWTLAFLAFSFLGVDGRRQSKLADNFKSITNETRNERQGKVFSLFNIVQFKNGGCRSTSTISSGGTGSTNRNGTCFTTTECAAKRGTAAGSCAAGFGVCCVFLVSTSGATINQNCTYIRNPNFPNAYDSTSQVGYNIQKCDPRVCQLRLDFESFTIQGTGNTDETDTILEVAGGVCLDMFTVSTNTGSSIPTICGQNTGQHIYIDMGCLNSDTAALNFNFGGTDTNRLWEIKVTQLICNTQGHPNGCGCLQYHTGVTGRLTSFNFLPTNDNHLANQEYGICIRQEEGMCCIEYTPSTCSTSSGNVLNNRLCGQKFNVLAMAMIDAATLCDCTKPFQVDVFFNDNNELGDPIMIAMAQSR